MPAVHVRNIDAEVVQALKERARRNHRSLEAEIRYILEREATEGSLPRELPIKTVSVGGPVLSRDEIYDAER